MTETLVQYVQWGVELGRTWGPLLVLLLMAVESSFIPFPSEIVMIPAGFMAARGEFLPADPVAGLVTAVVCGILGSLLGAFLNYGLSLRLGRPFLHRWGRYVLLSPHAVERAEQLFRRHGEIATFVCRLLPGIRQLISIPAGISRMNFGRFTLFTALGAGIWVTILGWIGFVLGRGTRAMTYPELVHAGHRLLRENYGWILLGCVAVIAGYVWLHRRVMSGSTRAVAHEQETPR
jgi:membrane protein DedA with SNARE-associated domain